MLPSTGYFKTLPCPFHETGLCERPYCHFKHIKPDAVRSEEAVEPPQPLTFAPVYDWGERGGSLQSPWGEGGSNHSGWGPAPTNPGYSTKPGYSTADSSATSITTSSNLSAVAASQSIAAAASTPIAAGNPLSALTAAGNPLALLTAGIEQEKLETLIQEAVRKLLVGEGKVIPATLSSQIQVKEEVDDDIIVEYCDVKINRNVKAELVPASARPEAEPRAEPRLYLPPPDTPVYNPTPISELEKRRSLETADHGTHGGAGPSNIPSGLRAASSLNSAKSSARPITSKGKKTFSYEPPVVSGSVLGDTEDMSESDEGEESPDVLGSILKEGNASGVLTGGVHSNFEELVIKERWKLLKKKLNKDEGINQGSAGDAAPLESDQCDKVSSSVEGSDLSQDPAETKEKEPKETEEEREARLVREEEEEIKKLEEKRLILENYYKKRLKEASLEKEKSKSSSKSEKEKSSKTVSKKEDGKSSHSSSKSTKQSCDRSKLPKKSEHHVHSSRKKDGRKSSNQKRDSSAERRSSKRSKKKTNREKSRRSKSRKTLRHRRSPSSSETESDFSDSSDASSTDEDRRRRKRKKSSHKKRKSDIKKGDRKRQEESTRASTEDTELNSADSCIEEVKHERAATLIISSEEDLTPPLVAEFSEYTEECLTTEIKVDTKVDTKVDIKDNIDVKADPTDAFKMAEFRIKELLAKKHGLKPEVKPERNIVKKELKVSPAKPTAPLVSTPNPQVQPKTAEAAIKPEIKLRSLAELVGAESTLDPRNIFFHADETFSDMIRRHETSWQELEAGQPGMTDQEKDSEEVIEPQNNISFLDAISMHDKVREKDSKKVKDRKRSRSSSSRSRDHKKHKKDDRRHSNKKKDHERKRSKSRERDSARGKGKKHNKDKDAGSSRERAERSSHPRPDSKGAPTPGSPLSEVGRSSPLPDFSEELADLPDLGEDNIEADMDAIFGGMEKDEELRRIFKDYQAEDRTGLDPARSKLQDKPRVEVSTAAGGRQRVAYEGAGDQAETKRPLHFRKPQLKTAAQTLAERYRKIQAMRQQSQIEQRLAEITSETEAGPSCSQPPPLDNAAGTKKYRLAHTVKSAAPPPVLGKTKQQLLARQTSGEKPEATTTAQTTKGATRIAHTPTTVAATKPVVLVDPNNKVPMNIRQRYLDSIVEECLKIYGGDELQAYPRAEMEEKDCSRKASSRMIYLNLAVNKIKKLRTEAAEAKSSGGSKPLTADTGGKRSLLTTHMQVLAGRPGTLGTWSIERPVRLTDEDIDEEMLYGIMRCWILSEEELVLNRFPRPDPQEPGKAIVKVDPQQIASRPADPDKRKCDRCKAIYRVDKFGAQVDKDDCVHHWGRIYRKRGDRATGGHLSLFYCCQQGVDSLGCQVSKVHVTDVLDYNNMRGFVSTLDRGHQGPGRVFALDCEMCNTTQGNELTRVTVIDHEGQVCYESLVKPDNDIVDYNTRFSGITAEDLQHVNTTLHQVQAVLLMKFDAKDILIGHSLESDLKALKILHGTVVDTSVVFPHKMGAPFKRALKFLAAEHLKRIIQNDVGGHDSKEDALACLDLMKMKVRQEVQKLQKQQKKARLQEAQ